MSETSRTPLLDTIHTPEDLRRIPEADLRQVVDELQLAHPDRAVRVVHEGPQDGRWDADRVAQAVGNLVSNALQHTEAGVEVDICCRGTDGSMTIAVHNGGPPIPASALPRLFEPFVRGEGPSASRSVGLGLYITQAIVAAHGGTIVATSSGRGGTVLMSSFGGAVCAESVAAAAKSSAAMRVGILIVSPSRPRK